MTNNSRTNVILIILGIIVLAGAAYMLFAKGEPTSAVSETGEVIGTETESTFLALTAEIGSISFNTSIFSDPRFAALRDIRTPILPEQTGRPDPFAPLQGLPATAP